MSHSRSRIRPPDGVEGLDLNKRNLNFTITRVLSGDRKAPQEKYLCTGDTVLSASLIPEQPFYQNVTWKDQENGKNLRLSSMGTHGEECKVTVRYDEKGQEHPAWIQNVVNADDQKWRKIRMENDLEALLIARQ